jgi:CHAT domain-containing protein/Flp pilus assembly protein TadD
MINDRFPTYDELLKLNPSLTETPIKKLNELLSVLHEYDYKWDSENQNFINDEIDYIIKIDSLHEMSAENIRILTINEIDFFKSHPIMVRLTRAFKLLSFNCRRFCFILIVLFFLFGWLIIPFNQVLLITLIFIAIGISIVGVSYLLNKSLDIVTDSQKADSGTIRSSMLSKLRERIILDRAYKLIELAEIASQNENHAKQIKLCEKVISSLKKFNSPPSIIFHAMFGAADGYQSLGELDKALDLLEKARLMYPTVRDELFSNILSILSTIYISQKKFENAEKILTELFQLKQDHDLPSDSKYAFALTNFAIIKKKNGENKEAISTNIQALELIRKAQGEFNLDYAIITLNLASLYEEVGEYKQSKNCLQKVAQICFEIFDPENLDLTTVLIMLGQGNLILFELNEAETYFNRALEIRKNILGTAHPKYREVLSNLAGVYNRKGDFISSERLYIQALQITEQMVGNQHPDYARDLNNLAALYDSMGNYSESIKLNLKSIAILKAQTQVSFKIYSNSVNNLAVTYITIGDYRKAERLLHESVMVYKNHFGPEHPNYARALSNYAQLHIDLGNFEKAINELQSVKKVFLKALGANHPYYAMTLTLIAIINRSSGNFVEAEKLNIEALDVLESGIGIQTIEYSDVLNNIALVYLALSDFEQAKVKITESIEIRERILGKDHPDIYHLWINLALILIKLGDFDKAEEIITSTVLKIKEIFGEIHPSYVHALMQFCELKLARQEYSQASSLIQRALEINQKHARNTIVVLTQFEKYAFIKQDDSVYDIAIALQNLDPSKSLIRLYENILFRKGLVLNSTMNVKHFFSASKHDSLRNLYEEWQSRLIALNRFQNLTIQQREKVKSDIQRLEEEAEELDKRINQTSSELSGFLILPEYNWCSIRDTLKQDEIILDFVKYQNFSEVSVKKYRYGVFITRQEYDTPYFLDLLDGERFESEILPMYFDNLLTIENKYFDGKFSGLISDHKNSVDYSGIHEGLLAPLVSRLENIKKLYLILDGEMHRINFNTIQNPDTGRYLIEDFEISQVLNPHTLTLEKSSKPYERTAVLFGYPNFDSSLEMVSDINIPGKFDSSETLNSPEIKENVAINYPPLPGTLEEVELLEELLHINNWEVESFIQDDANETNLKKVKSPTLLLVATHGYFDLKGETDIKLNDTVIYETKKAFNDPMLKSGLLLAGANNFLSAQEQTRMFFEENGIFTAHEAAMLDLFETDIVILSACDSGTGEIKRGEGVFGLQRGFFSAGAKSVLMSLWKVDDNSTKELMSRFVKKYAKGIEKQTALRETQLELMKQNPHPHYWGSFVLVER